MPYNFNRAVNYHQRSVYQLAASIPVGPVLGDLVHSIPSAGVTLDSTSSTLVTSYVDQTSSSTATPSSTSWVNAPRFRPAGVNGSAPGIYYPGAGFVGLRYDTAGLAVRNNVPGISFMATVAPDGNAAIIAPILFQSQGTNNGTNGFAVGCTANKAMYGAFRRTDTGTGGSTVTLTTPDNFYTPNEFFVLAVVADFAVGNGTDPIVTFYKNGVASYSAPLAGMGIGNTTASNALVCVLGGTVGATIGPNMIMGENYLYPRALTASEVLSKTGDMKTVAAIKSLQILTPTNYQGFNRNLITNTATISISGIYDTTAGTQPTAIEASWNGSAYTTIASGSVGTMTGGAFSGMLTGMSPGQGDLIVRYTNDTTQTCTRKYVTVSDVVLMVGQSNNTDVLDPTYSDANGAQSPKTYTLGSSGMKIPGFNTRFAYAKWFDINKMSSYHVAFAQDYYNKHGFPPILVFGAIGGTNSTKWRSDSVDTYGSSPNTIGFSFYDFYGAGQTLVARAVALANAATTNTGVNIILDEQGEADSGTVTQSTFLANKTNTYAALRTAFPNSVILPALLQAQTGSGGSAIDVSAVNAAYVQTYTTLPGVAPGADLSGLTSDLGGSGVSGVTRVHLMSDSNVAAQAAAWAASAQTAAGYGPILDNITTSSTRTAHALRKLRAGYAGSCILARRSSDGATQAIGFDTYGNLDTTALIAFSQGGTVTVATIYDQTALAADYTAGATAQQGQIVVAGSLNLYNGRPFIQFDQSTTYYNMASPGLGLFNAVSDAYVATVASETQNSSASPAYRIIMTAQTTTSGSTSSRYSVSTNNNGSVNNQFSAAYRKTDAGTIAFAFSGTAAGAQYTGTVPFVFHNEQKWGTSTNNIYFNGALIATTATGQTAGTTDATNCDSIRLGASAGGSPTQLSHMRFNEIIMQGGAISAIDRVKLAHSQGFYWGAAIA